MKFNLLQHIFKYFLFGLYFLRLTRLIESHGMMIEPLGRASRWRFNSSAPINWDDNGLFCGGYQVQWDINNGKCGLCGDDYRALKPRPHEYGGLYGEGILVNSFISGNVIPVAINLTSNHWGDFTWDICNMDIENETDECFSKIKLKLVDGRSKYVLKSGKDAMYKIILRIPNDLSCKHCVLRWTYRTANSWGWCEDGKGALGCGPQEYFRSCADISIKNLNNFIIDLRVKNNTSDTFPKAI